MPSSAGHYPPGQQQQQQQQQSVIQKWALVRPDTLQDLLAHQRGTSSVHHGGGTNQEDKDCHHHLSSPLGLVAHSVSSPDSNTATSWRSQWDISSATLEPWLGRAANWETAGKCRQWGEDSHYGTSVRNSTWSFTWAATGDLTRACTVAPESGIMPGTQWLTATCWSTPWPSTNHACNKSWAWPGWRAAVSTEDVAWRSWGWFPIGPGLCWGSWQTLALALWRHGTLKLIGDDMEIWGSNLLAI